MIVDEKFIRDAIKEKFCRVYPQADPKDVTVNLQLEHNTTNAIVRWEDNVVSDEQNFDGPCGC